MSRITKECPRGHVYEPDFPDSEDCPYCAQMERGYQPKKTLPIYPGESALEPKPSPGPLHGVAGGNPTPVGRAKTQAVYDTDVVDPVAGWLVATVGPIRGQDFRVPMGRSSFGRDASCRICIAGDPTISSQQGFITYSRNRRFTISPGDGSCVLYVNGVEVLSPTDLIAYDVIEMGRTVMTFIPFCSDRFDWTEAAAGGSPK